MATSYPPRFTALESLQRNHKSEKPLPTPPSPTLTNPDLVLPDSSPRITLITPTSSTRVSGRPPSPSYLLDNVRDPSSLSGKPTAASRYSPRARRDIESRNSSLRERASSARLVRRSPGPGSGSHDDSDASTERGSTISSDYGSVMRSSSTSHQIKGRLGTKIGSSNGGSSPASDGFTGVSQFLADYRRSDGNEEDSDHDVDNDTTNGDDVASSRHSISVSVIENGIEVQRRIQEEEEHTSAILSRRAEEILANAKRRLNLMEGNLRGARDLVAPLTAANLKRAASLGSAYHSPFSAHSRFLYGTSDNGQAPSEPVRASSAAPDHPGHWRNFSDVQVAERPTSKTPSFSRRLPVNVTETPWTASLRASKSFDSLGAHHRGRPSLAKISLESPLETLREDENLNSLPTPSLHAFETESNAGLGISRDCATPDDIRSQMSSLKGRISVLRQRAQEDSSRRRSMQSLRTTSSMASLSDRDRAYESARASPVPSTVSNGSWNQGMHTSESTWRQSPGVAGSRNAFAEQAARQSDVLYSTKALPTLPDAPGYGQSAAHKAIENWRSDHAIGLEEAIPIHTRNSHPEILYEDTEPESGCDEASSEDGTSVYEDADTGIEADEGLQANTAIVAHEDRIDAFDYQQFFVSSAVTAYGPRRGSTSSDGSASSTSTAKRPASRNTEVETYDPSGDPPPTPETPERLREIERSLQHNRAPSSASMLTVATFKTAREQREPKYPSWSTSTPTYSRPQTAMERPRTARISGDNFQQRPHTVMDEHRVLRERTSSSLGRDSDSDRADSGVGFSKRSPNENAAHSSPSRMRMIKPSSAPLTPPMSPTDPVARAVNALLDPNGRSLGLKEKALLFGAVENLRKLALQLQRSDEVSLAGRVLRQKLDDARRVLESSNVDMGRT